METEKILKEIGLTKSEVAVYLALLKIGETTTGDIVSEAQISSGKIYEVLDKLIQKGLASYNVVNNTKHFSASSPKRLMDYMHEKEEELKQKEKQLEKKLPALFNLQEQSEKEREAIIFEGFKGIESAAFEALENCSKKETIKAMGITHTKSKQYNLMWQKWHKKRVEEGISCQLLFTKENSDYYSKLKSLKLTETRIITGITPSAIDIIGDRVLIFTYEDPPSCISIEIPEIVKSFTTFFDTLWKQAEK